MKKRTGNKYGAQKIVYEGVQFNSLAEAKFYRILLDTKEVAKIEFEPKFILLAAFEYMGEKVRPITYKADFLVTYTDGSKEVVEIKGFSEARDWPLREKLFKYNNPDKVLKVYTECPKKYGGGFVLLSELKKLRTAEKRRKTRENKEQ